MTTTRENETSSTLEKALNRPDVQESAAYLIDKLPEIQTAFESLEEVIQFGLHTFKDRDSMDQIEQRLALSSVNQETLESLLQLIGKLPVLLKLVERLEELTVFAESVLQDKASLESLQHSIESNPLAQKGKDVLAKADEVKALAESRSDEKVSVWEIIKWMKDPSVQQGLRYIQATLEVINRK